jgi:squalene-associated FAD-dependent desaturase
MSNSIKPPAASRSERSAADTLPLAELEPEISGNIANASKSIAIIGGGLAGMAAAAVACHRGLQVDLFEQSDHLGGRACSMEEPWNGQTIDQCQHVAMGCCTNFLDFCRRTGVEDCFQRHKTLHFIGPDGSQSDIAAAAWLPAPLHLLPGLLRLKHVSWRERCSIVRVIRKLVSLNESKENYLKYFGTWLRSQGESETTIERFWSVVIMGALSETIDFVSLMAAKKVFLDGFCSSRNDYELITPLFPLGEILDRHVSKWLEQQGVRIHRGTKIKNIFSGKHGLAMVPFGGPGRLYLAAIVAVTWYDLDGICDLDGMLYTIKTRPWQKITKTLQPAAITAVHLWFDRPITTLPYATFAGRLSQWVFNETALMSTIAQGNGGYDSQIQENMPTASVGMAPDQKNKSYYYQVVISAAHRMAKKDKMNVLQTVLNDLGEVFPHAKQAELLHWRIVTIPRAVFSMLPGVDQLRLPQKTAIPNLFLAGDWTATGWPGTMEGAVWSGYLAAEELLKYLGR